MRLKHLKNRRTFVITLVALCINFKWMEGGQVDPIKSITIENNNNNNNIFLNNNENLY